MPASLAIVALLIAAVWAILLGTAYLVRLRWQWQKGASVAAVTICYLILALLALLWLGSGTRGQLGAFGMLAPYATAVALAVGGRR